jgi:peptide/nickel transport system substrate-binding protein
MSRAQFLKGAAVAGAGVAFSDALAACGGSSSPNATTTSAAAAKPKPGGNLRMGMIGAGTSESLNPAFGGLNTPNGFRCLALYDSLIRLNPDNSLTPALAVESIPNKDYTAWTFKLRQGVEFHNGKTMTADDVIYSFHYMAKPSNEAASILTNVKFGDIKALDKYTVMVPLTSPDTLFLDKVSSTNAAIIPAGLTNFTRPVGTGPFRYKSFTVGQQSVFLRNPHYWESPKPYFDELTMTSITDDTARLNALLSGQINALANLPYTEGKAQASNPSIKLLQTTGNIPYLFYMRTDRPPFDNVNVRQAIKYIVNRPQMLNIAIEGFGAIANDLVGAGLQYYNTELPQREQDIEKAKSLLRAAGHSSLSLKLYISPILPGLTQAGTLLVGQAKPAGVNISLVNVPATEFFDTSLLYLKMPFASSYWGIPNLPTFYQSAFGPKAPFPETHFNDPAFASLIARATSATNPATARSLWYELQKIQWEQGGYCVWANADILDALAHNVMGFVASHNYSLGAPISFINGWLA